MNKWSLALALSAIASPAAAAREPEILPRTGSWEVNYDSDSCHLRARFGTGSAAVILDLTRFQPGDAFSLNLYGERLKRLGSAPSAKAKITFGAADLVTEEPAMFGEVAGLPVLLFGAVRLDGWRGRYEDAARPRITPEQEAAVSEATFAFSSGSVFRLTFGPLAKPMAALRKCTDDLLRTWGYDPEVQARLSKPVERLGNPGGWFLASDYPAKALQQGHSGIVRFRLDVDDRGKVAGCHVVARTSPDEFADTTCALITRRARLAPALDEKGAPVRSFLIHQVTWNYPS